MDVFGLPQGLRKTHGVAMVVANLFLNPLSIVMARYYKETYLKLRPVTHLHLWYSVRDAR